MAELRFHLKPSVDYKINIHVKNMIELRAFNIFQVSQYFTIYRYFLLGG
jgi:hypothetical protein